METRHRDHPCFLGTCEGERAPEAHDALPCASRISHGFALHGVHQMMDCAACTCGCCTGVRACPGLTFFDLIDHGRQMLIKLSEDAVFLGLNTFI